MTISISRATKIGYVTNVDVEVCPGCHLEDIPSFPRVSERHTLAVYCSGIEITSKNESTGAVPDLIHKGVEHITVVICDAFPAKW